MTAWSRDQVENLLAERDGYRDALSEIISVTPDEPDHAHGDGGYEAGRIAREAVSGA